MTPNSSLSDRFFPTTDIISKIDEPEQSKKFGYFSQHRGAPDIQNESDFEGADLTSSALGYDADLLARSVPPIAAGVGVCTCLCSPLHHCIWSECPYASPLSVPIYACRFR